MDDEHDLVVLYRTLEVHPRDHLTLLALADWYEEHDQLAAGTCLRWAGTQRRFPYCYRYTNKLLYHCERWHEGWFWWVTDREKEGWGYPKECELPHRLWECLHHDFKFPPKTFKEYPGLREAYEQLIVAWRTQAEAAREAGKEQGARSF